MGAGRPRSAVWLRARTRHCSSLNLSLFICERGNVTSSGRVSVTRNLHPDVKGSARGKSSVNGLVVPCCLAKCPNTERGDAMGHVCHLPRELCIRSVGGASLDVSGCRSCTKLEPSHGLGLQCHPRAGRALDGVSPGRLARTAGGTRPQFLAEGTFPQGWLHLSE